MQNINREHPDYIARKAMWKQYKDLYAGGEQLRLNAGEYLVRRQKEPGQVYGERLRRVFYENYVGSIVDWYAATLMRSEEHTSELQSLRHLVCRLLLEKKKKNIHENNDV